MRDDRTVLGLIEGLTEVFRGIWRMAKLFWDLWKDGRVVLGQIEGLADVFEGIGWEAKLFWDLSKAWPMCLKGLDERPSCFETYGGLGRWVWSGCMGGWRVIRLMEGLADMFEAVGWEADVLWDLLRVWPTCLKGLEGRPTCYGTYDITKERSRVAKEKRLFIFFLIF